MSEHWHRSDPSLIVRLAELKDEVKNSAEWKQKEEENKQFLTQLAAVFGEKKISLSKVSGRPKPWLSLTKYGNILTRYVLQVSITWSIAKKFIARIRSLVSREK